MKLLTGDHKVEFFKGVSGLYANVDGVGCHHVCYSDEVPSVIESIMDLFPFETEELKRVVYPDYVAVEENEKEKE